VGICWPSLLSIHPSSSTPAVAPFALTARTSWSVDGVRTPHGGGTGRPGDDLAHRAVELTSDAIAAP
jgi:hypothetical protein